MFNEELQVLTQIAAQVGCEPTDTTNYYGTLVQLPVLKNYPDDAGRLETVMTVHVFDDPTLPECTIVRDKQTGIFYKTPHETKPA